MKVLEKWKYFRGTDLESTWSHIMKMQFNELGSISIALDGDNVASGFAKSGSVFLSLIAWPDVSLKTL
jgi:hypothetical protein